MKARKLKEVCRAVREALGERIICARCKATLETLADRCNVETWVRCEGFNTIETAINAVCLKED